MWWSNRQTINPISHHTSLLLNHASSRQVLRGRWGGWSRNVQRVKDRKMIWRRDRTLRYNRTKSRISLSKDKVKSVIKWSDGGREFPDQRIKICHFRCNIAATDTGQHRWIAGQTVSGWRNCTKQVGRVYWTYYSYNLTASSSLGMPLKLDRKSVV